MTRPLSMFLMLIVLVLAACGGEASTCEEIADQTIDLAQQLIDDVEDEKPWRVTPHTPWSTRFLATAMWMYGSSST